MFDTRAFLMVAVCAVITFLLRAIPFWVFGGGRKAPAFVDYLGSVLPYAIIGMLVVYCLKGVSFAAAPHGIPELISCAIVVGLHLWKKNTLLSIIGGTVCYMLLVQLVF